MKWLISSIVVMCCAGCQDLPNTKQAVQPDDDVTRAYQVKVENDKAILARVLEEERQTLDARIGDQSGLCQLHQTQLSEGVVPLRFGFPLWTDEYTKARLTLFLNAESFHQTCVVSEHRYARVLYCRVCRTVESQWESGRRGEEIQVPARDELTKDEEAANFR